MGWEGSGWAQGWPGTEAIASPDVRDIAAVVLVCTVAYAMRHAGTTFTGFYAGFVGKLEAYRRAARHP